MKESSRNEKKTPLWINIPSVLLWCQDGLLGFCCRGQSWSVISHYGIPPQTQLVSSQSSVKQSGGANQSQQDIRWLTNGRKLLAGCLQWPLMSSGSISCVVSHSVVVVRALLRVPSRARGGQCRFYLSLLVKVHVYLTRSIQITQTCFFPHSPLNSMIQCLSLYFMTSLTHNAL